MPEEVTGSRTLWLRATMWLRAHRALTLVILGAALVRVVGLATWPAVQADEGLWTISTKNFLMFHDWFMDRQTHLFLSPVFHALTLPMFAVFGPSIASARIVSALAGIVSTVLLYFLVRDDSEDRRLAVTAAALFAFSQFTVVISRSALIESTQLAFVLGAARILTARRVSKWSAASAGLLFGFALLTKVNVAILMVVLVVWLEFEVIVLKRRPTSTDIATGLMLVAASLVTAGLGYILLYKMAPGPFVNAFRFELNGVHFESISHPIVRFGRFGLDPVQSARTIIGLVREAPVLLVLAALGAVYELLRGARGSRLFGTWLALGSLFFLLQMFQPERYFYLVTPAYAYFAAVAIQRFDGGTDTARARSWWRRRPALTTYLLFAAGYLGASAMTSRETRIATVNRWVADHTTPSARIMAASYLCTGMDRRCYSYYRYAAMPGGVLPAVDQLGIGYIIADDAEWSAARRDSLDSHFQRVQVWPFGTVYKVGPVSWTPRGQGGMEGSSHRKVDVAYRAGVSQPMGEGFRDLRRENHRGA